MINAEASRSSSDIPRLSKGRPEGEAFFASKRASTSLQAFVGPAPWHLNGKVVPLMPSALGGQTLETGTDSPLRTCGPGRKLIFGLIVWFHELGVILVAPLTGRQRASEVVAFHVFHATVHEHALCRRPPEGGVGGTAKHVSLRRRTVFGVCHHDSPTAFRSSGCGQPHAARGSTRAILTSKAFLQCCCEGRAAHSLKTMTAMI